VILSYDHVRRLFQQEPTPTDNGATPEDQHVDSNKRMMGNETDNVILAHGIKDEIQKSAELKVSIFCTLTSLSINARPIQDVLLAYCSIRI